MIEFESELLDVIPRTPNVKSFRFKAKEDIDFKAGQFFLVTIKIAGIARTKHFSFSNSPTEKGYVEFTKRITTSDFSQALDRIEIGAWVRLKMPLGTFIFTGEDEKIAFLSGGIGITPIRSICKFVTDRRMATDLVLLYGNNKEEDIIFRQDFDQMQKANQHIRIVYTLTAKDIDRKDWLGRVGFIDDEMIKEEIPDYKERVFYICGPPNMVTTLVAILKNRLAVGADRIKTENFTGYN